MEVAIILSGFGVIFALITALLYVNGEEHRAFISGVIALIFEIVGVAIATGYLLGGL